MDVSIIVDGTHLSGILHIPKNARGMVLFAHGSGSSRLSSRNQFVAKVLDEAHFATLLFDLLTPAEDIIDMKDAHLRFDIELLADRLSMATDWVLWQEKTKHFSLGYFGASTGAAAALVSASSKPNKIKAVVSRGGRPDLAGDALKNVFAPTLLIVGGNDDVVLDLNKHALKQLGSSKKALEIVAGATHLFEEEGTLLKAAHLARDWFARYL